MQVSSAPDPPESEVAKQLPNSVAKKQALAMSEDKARKRIGTILVFSSLGVLVKDDTGLEVKVTLFIDDTNGVPVNGRIRARDRDGTLAAPDVKRLLGTAAQQEHRSFAPKLHVKGLASAWMPQHRDGPVFKNTTGTFGVASAAYWRPRFEGA